MAGRGRKKSANTLPVDDSPLPPVPDAVPQPVRRQTGPYRARPDGAPAGTIGTTLKLLFIIGALAALAFPTFIVIMGGMVPTLVAILVSERTDRHKIQTLAAFNMCGVVFFLVPLWTGGHTMHQAMVIMSNVYSWAVMYMAAALGMGALWLGPHVAALVYNVLVVGRRRKIESIRRALLDEWGPDILPDGEVAPGEKKTKAKERARQDAA